MSYGSKHVPEALWLLNDKHGWFGNRGLAVWCLMEEEEHEVHEAGVEQLSQEDYGDSVKSGRCVDRWTKLRDQDMELMPESCDFFTPSFCECLLMSALVRVSLV